MANKWPIDRIEIKDAVGPVGSTGFFSQIEPDLGNIQVGLNVEVTAHGYLITRDWPQERDVENEFSLYAKEKRDLIEKFYYNAGGQLILKVAMSTEWEPVKESRRLHVREIEAPPQLPKPAPFLQMSVGGKVENESQG